MRVLWFTNIQMPDYAAQGRGIAPVVGGWMPSLLAAIMIYAPELEIAVAFEGEKQRKIEVDGVRYYCLGRMYWRLNGHSPSLSFMDSVRRCIDDFCPDLIHFHGSEGIARGFGDKTIFKNIPLVVSMQGIINGYYPFYTGGLSPSEIAPFATLTNRILGKTVFEFAEGWRKHLCKAERNFLRTVDGVFGRTFWDRSWARVLAPRGRYCTVGELLRQPFYSGIRNQGGIKKHTIYCSAALSYPLKGGHWLVRAVAILKQKYPDVQLRVVSARRNHYPSGLLGRLRQGQYARYIDWLVQDLDVEENIEFLPSLTAEEVRKELESAEVFCLPSLVENSPNSLGEAIMTGVPSVVTGVGGVPSFVDDCETGYVVPAADPATLAVRISEIFDNPGRGRQFAENAYAKMNKLFSPSAVVEQLIDAYDRIFAKNLDKNSGGGGGNIIALAPPSGRKEAA